MILGELYCTRSLGATYRNMPFHMPASYPVVGSTLLDQTQAIASWLSPSKCQTEPWINVTFLGPFYFRPLFSFSDHVTFSIPHHLIDHMTSHLTSHLTLCQQHMTFLGTKVLVSIVLPFYCPPIWDTLLFFSFSLLSYLLSYVIDPHFLLAMTS